MTEMLKTLPLGVEKFTEIINNNLYYVDKTPLIRDILQDGAKLRCSPVRDVLAKRL